jgi:hypothetical protein
MTNPPVLREVRTPWVGKPQVYHRPEVMNTSIGRQNSYEEAQLEPYFRPLLERPRMFTGRPSTQLHVCSGSLAGYARDS